MTQAITIVRLGLQLQLITARLELGVGHERWLTQFQKPFLSAVYCTSARPVIRDIAWSVGPVHRSTNMNNNSRNAPKYIIHRAKSRTEMEKLRPGIQMARNYRDQSVHTFAACLVE